MEKHKIEVQRKLQGICNLKAFKKFEPAVDAHSIERLKDDKFHVSNTAIALYCNGFTKKAVHDAPFGYLYNEGDLQAAFGVFRRFDGKNYLIIIPLEGGMQAALHVIGDSGLMDSPAIEGVYVRFLDVSEYVEALSETGFLPAKEHPWDPNAPEEDETLCQSRVDLTKLKLNAETGYNRGKKFVERNELSLRFELLGESRLGVAYEIIKGHFKLLENAGKRVGSTPEDYLGLLQPEIINLEAVTAVIGFLNDLPVSVFIAERTGSTTVSMYSTIVVRDTDYLKEKLGIATEDKKRADGVGAISAFLLLSFLKQLREQGMETTYLGGSEIADLNKAKIQLGAENDPTYWAVQLR